MREARSEVEGNKQTNKQTNKQVALDPNQFKDLTQDN
jgi:hypothetical protein